MISSFLWRTLAKLQHLLLALPLSGSLFLGEGDGDVGTFCFPPLSMKPAV